MLREQATRWLVAATALCLSLPAAARINLDHYRIGLVAATGSGSFSAFGDNVSINRAGTIAFALSTRCRRSARTSNGSRTAA